ncbi:MAG: hypothetical protein ABJD68_17700, partial [Nakamurella sp.]
STDGQPCGDGGDDVVPAVFGRMAVESVASGLVVVGLVVVGLVVVGLVKVETAAAVAEPTVSPPEPLAAAQLASKSPTSVQAPVRTNNGDLRPERIATPFQHSIFVSSILRKIVF